MVSSWSGHEGLLFGNLDDVAMLFDAEALDATARLLEHVIIGRCLVTVHSKERHILDRVHHVLQGNSAGNVCI